MGLKVGVGEEGWDEESKKVRKKRTACHVRKMKKYSFLWVSRIRVIY